MSTAGRMMMTVDHDAGGVRWLTLRLPLPGGGAVESVSKILPRHDYHQRTRDAVDALIRYARKHGADL